MRSCSHTGAPVRAHALGQQLCNLKVPDTSKCFNWLLKPFVGDKQCASSHTHLIAAELHLGLLSTRCFNRSRQATRVYVELVDAHAVLLGGAKVMVNDNETCWAESDFKEELQCACAVVVCCL